MWWFVGAFIAQVIFNVWILWKLKKRKVDDIEISETIGQEIAKTADDNTQFMEKLMGTIETNTDTLENHQNVLFDLQERLGRSDGGDLFDAWEPWKE